MIILSADTSTENLSLALMEDDKIIKKYHSTIERSGDYLFTGINEFLKSSNIQIDEVDLFAVGLGPGSFTGLRIGLCCFKTFAFCMHKPLIGINSFDALAYQFKETVETGRLICAAADAKKDRIYAAMYVFNKNRELKIKHKCALFKIEEFFKKVYPASRAETGGFTGGGVINIPKGKLSNAARKPPFIIGDVIEKNRAYFLAEKNKFLLAEKRLWYPKAQIIAALAKEKFEKGRRDDPLKLEPLYLHSHKANITKPKRLV